MNLDRVSSGTDLAIRILLFSLFLFPPAAGYALTDKLGPDLTEKAPVHSAKTELSENLQDLLDGIRTPDAALGKSREYQQKGLFGLSKLVLQHGIEIARTSGSDFAELTLELEYNMPILQAKELLVLGKPDDADKILESLAKNFSSDQKRIDEISALRDALTQSRFLAAAKRDNEQAVTRDVRRKMSGYYRQHGVFPNYTELNRLLPANDKVLQNYEIIYFKSVPNAYRMVLRNLYNPENLLKIEATGLMK